MSAAATKRIGVRNLDAMHQQALRGYVSGGAVGAPLGSAPPAAAAGGVSKVEVSLTEGLEAKLLEAAGKQSVQIVKRGLTEYDRSSADRAYLRQGQSRWRG